MFSSAYRPQVFKFTRFIGGNYWKKRCNAKLFFQNIHFLHRGWVVFYDPFIVPPIDTGMPALRSFSRGIARIACALVCGVCVH